MSNVFELTNVYKTYKNDGKEFEALKDVSLEVREGEIFGLIGMSGAGKLTAQKMLEDGLDAGLICRYTGLSIDEIKKLQGK